MGRKPSGLDKHERKDGRNMEERKGPERMEDCLPLLLSGDRKKRLVGEYWEMKIRSAALKEYIERRTEEEHGWNETMEHHIMSRQLSDMLGYLSCLGLRATEKDIDLMDTAAPKEMAFMLAYQEKREDRTTECSKLYGNVPICVDILLGLTIDTVLQAAKTMAKEENGCK